MYPQPMSKNALLATFYKKGFGQTPATFASNVSRDKAPKPDLHLARTPLWAPESVEAHEPPADRRREAEPTQPGPLELDTIKMFEKAEGLPGNSAPRLLANADGPFDLARLAVLHLPEFISEWAAAADSHENEATQAHIAAAQAEEKVPYIFSNPVRWLRLSRESRASWERSSEQWARADGAHDVVEAAQADLDRAEAWLTRAKSWAAWWEQDVESRRTHKALDTWLADLLEEHRPRPEHLVRTLDWVTENPTRIAFINDMGDHREKATVWARLTPEQRAGLEPGQIILGGGDLGYNWRVPGLDERCRLSFVQATGELYLVASRSASGRGGVVLPLCTIPHTSFDAVIQWVAPFERMLSHPSAYGLLVEEVRLQEKLGWPGVRNIHALTS